MAALVFWRPPYGGPDDAEKDARKIRVARREAGTEDPYVEVVELPLLDLSDNFLTSYEDSDGVPAGEDGEHEYKVTFLTRTGGAIPGASIEGIGGVEPYYITPADVRKYIENLDTGNTTDEWINERIEGAKVYIESRIRANIGIATESDERQDGTGGSMIHLFHRPLIDVTSLTLQFPFAGFQRDIPHDWLIMDRRHSLVRIIPPAHQAYLILQASSAFPMSYNLSLYPPLPHVIRAAYQHGLYPVPADLRDAWLKQSAVEALQVIGDAKGGGISSKSIDGVSESYTASATTHIYSARIKWYQEDIERVIQRYERISLTVASIRWAR